MIRVDKNTALTVKNIAICYKVWQQDYARIKKNDDIFTNKAELKIPYGKKLVVTSAAATLGDGITVSAPDSLNDKQKATFDAIQDLWNRQAIVSHDENLITDMITHCRAYELVYMSEDISNPLPKTAEYNALSAFVVFDDTAEANSLFACYVDSYKKGDKSFVKFCVVDKNATYEKEMQATELANITADLKSVQISTTESLIENDFTFVSKHPFGRVPMTEVKNNKEEQGDFEQAIPLMYDRTDIHEINLKDSKKVAKNYVEARNTDVAGDTEEEKNVTQQKMADNQRYSYKTDKRNPDSRDGLNIVSKNENYSSIDIYAKDIDNKIYDISMIVDISNQQFAGNVSGVALNQKFFVFINMVKRKNGELEKMYKRRLKMYMTALTAKDSTKYEAFDAALCTVTFNRSWITNKYESAQIMAILNTIENISKKSVVNQFTDLDYDEEVKQIANEQKEKAKQVLTNPDANNASLEQFNGILRGLTAANPTEATNGNES